MNDDPSTAYAVVEIVALCMYAVGVFITAGNVPRVLASVLNPDKVQSGGAVRSLAIGVTLIAVAAAIT